RIGLPRRRALRSARRNWRPSSARRAAERAGFRAGAGPATCGVRSASGGCDGSGMVGGRRGAAQCGGSDRVVGATGLGPVLGHLHRLDPPQALALDRRVQPDARGAGAHCVRDGVPVTPAELAQAKSVVALFVHAKAVVEAARAGLDRCVSRVETSYRPGVLVEQCCELASYTINSFDHPACSTHATLAVGQNSVWPHKQLPLLRSIEAFDAAVADAAREAL